jgi:hypothetical protein
MADELIDNADESLFAAGEEVYNSASVTLSRFGAYVRETATSSNAVGTANWISDLINPTTNPTNSFSGVIHEVLVFDRKLSETERQSVYSYLSKKYKLTDSLPDSFVSSHPSAELAGLTYWSIKHHPNSRGLGDIPTSTPFSNIPLEAFFHLPDQVYKSEGTQLQNGTVLTGDTYGAVSG